MFHNIIKHLCHSLHRGEGCNVAVAHITTIPLPHVVQNVGYNVITIIRLSGITIKLSGQSQYHQESLLRGYSAVNWVLHENKIVLSSVTAAWQ